jgi:hypothetical protein
MPKTTVHNLRLCTAAYLGCAVSVALPAAACICCCLQITGLLVDCWTWCSMYNVGILLCAALSNSKAGKEISRLSTLCLLQVWLLEGKANLTASVEAVLHCTADSILHCLMVTA